MSERPHYPQFSYNIIEAQALIKFSLFKEYNMVGFIVAVLSSLLLFGPKYRCKIDNERCRNNSL